MTSAIIKKMRLSRQSYLQLLYVTLAFVILVLTSYTFTAFIEKDHLKHDTENLFVAIEAQLDSDMREIETLLGVISENIRSMLIKGADFNEIKGYLETITDYGRNIRKIKGFVSVYAYFDIFGGAGYNGLGWEEPVEEAHGIILEEYLPKITSENIISNTIITEPFADIENHEVGVSFVSSINDNNGNRLAFLSIDVLLDQMLVYPSFVNSYESIYWTILDENLTIIAHPDKEFIGVPLYDLNSGIVKYAEELKKNNRIDECEFINYKGELNVISIRQIENNWLLGVAVSKDNYFKNLKLMQRYLIILGLILTIGLSIILIRLIKVSTSAEEYAHLLFEAMPLCANFWNKNFQNINTNDEAVRFFELSSKQEYLERFFDLSPEFQPDGENSTEKAYRLIKKAFDEGYCRFEWLHHKFNGELLPCEVTLVRIKHKDEYIVAGYTRDLRESKAKELAEKSSYNKSAFLANMSHEIRTPMSAILGIAEIQLQKDNLENESKEAFGKIYESGSLLLHIVNDILDLSKIEAGKIEISPVKYDIPSLMNDTIQLNCLRYESKGINFEFNIDKNTPLNLIGDELRIKQILNNILSNAFKYTNTGKVSMSVAFEHLIMEPDKDVIIIFTISDTGQGMTKDQLKILFDEYTRFNVEANRTTVGAGLGMSITKHLVDMMNGSIDVQSTPGQGSVFTVRIPQRWDGHDICGEEVAKRLEDFSYKNKIRSQAKREYMPYGSVLVVDDVESNLFVAKGLLSPYELKIETASSGFETIEKIKAGHVYDIIFMDHMMPKMDGLETVKIIRGMDYKHPIIALTANAIIGQSDIFLANGFDGFISKPIDSNELDDLLINLIYKKQSSEVIEKARKEQAAKSAFVIPNKYNIPGIEKIFLRDAENAVTILNDFNAKIEDKNSLDEEDLKTYITTVHGMKTALLNIDEINLSNIALNLEKAGFDNNFSYLKDETAGFVYLLGDLAAGIKQKIRIKEFNREEVVLKDEDTRFLREKLEEIKTVCQTNNKNAAKAALEALLEREWPQKIHNLLDEISVHLLHSAFKKTISVIDNTEI